MTTLHDQLAALADDAPPGGPAPDLWDRGQGLARQRRAGAAGIAFLVVVAFVVLGTMTWSRSQSEPVPAGPTDGLRLPDQFFDPDPHLPAVGQPLGPLVAVVGAQRTDWLGRDTNALVGVSGTTGEYRFLELPERMGSEAPELSADGRWLAYWFGEGERFDGVAVYDATTNEVERLPVPSDHGLMPLGMTWMADELWFEIYEYDANGHSASPTGSMRWDPATGVHREEPSTPLTRKMIAGEVSGGALVSGVNRRLQVWDLPPAGPGSRLRTDVSVDDGALMSPDQTRIAAVEDPDEPGTEAGLAGRLLTLGVAEPGRLASTAVPDAETNALLGWRDRTHVVVLDYSNATYSSIDVATGERERLTGVAPGNWYPGTIVAQDAWAAPTYVAPEPPHPLPPLLVVGLGAGTVLVGVGALIWWRRRVRP